MVQSRLVTDLNYKEQNRLDLVDKEHESCLYIVPLQDHGDFVIALGKQRTDHVTQGVVYYPIYLISKKNHIKGKIGLYEADVSIATSLLDDEGDVDLSQVEDPLLFSYVTSEYLDKHGNHGEDLSAETISERSMEEIQKELEDSEFGPDEPDKDKVEVVDIEPDDSDEDSDDEDDLVNMKPKEKNIEESSIEPTTNKLTYDDVFEKESPLPTLPTWTPETEEENKKIKASYKNEKSLQDNWLVKILKNKHYKIHTNEGGGDCLFATLRGAYSQLGYKTTVQKLRQFLSQEVNLELFEHYKSIYDGISLEQQSLDHEMDKLNKTNTALKKQSEKTQQLQQQKDIVEEALHVKKQYQRKKTQKGGADDLMLEFKFMENVNNVDDLRTFVQTAEYWADDWAITTLERILSMKIIILDQTEDIESVLRCTQQQDDSFDPPFYILVNHIGNVHYELISYKDKKIFKFGEIPFGIKKMVVKNCMEKPVGVYSKIPAFKQFQHDMGVVIDSTESTEPEDIPGDLFDSNIVLSFHANSDKKKKPGKVEGDDVPVRRETEFANLSKIDLWRRKLDDSWTGGDGQNMAAFTTTDGKRWASVSHYLMSVKFKDPHPAIYDDFSLDSKSEISRDLDKAKASLEKKKGKIGKYHEESKKVSDLDDETRNVYRKDALRFKFNQNLDMKELLKETGTAKLVVTRPKFVDNLLMEIRREAS